MTTKHLTYVFLVSSAFSPLMLLAQSGGKDLREANKLYKEKKFDQSLQAYNKALQAAPNNSTINYNIGNANFRNNKFENAVNDYDNTVSNTNDNTLKQNAYYNKGVSFSKQKKLPESIEAYKDALKLNGNDKEARENLQKALMEQKQQQQQQQQNKQDNKKDNKKDQDKKQDQKQDQQPKEQQSKLNKQQVEQLLQALQQKEKEVQKKMQQKDASPTQPDKDW
ncbi:tetratricopeptide repeat protein [Pinibacter aurantiacus]|uniref:Tetratricopeptide repeat protein n=1 Tax=Pinibacter aurantiacus TaxID=2851599 RepID=A0A9E2S7N4_9BACT|nr:tetratricopeptide repeat protein [Pinibacter aurantiacus]MBV4356407.1 tetratricopeptide repeat protein [Pinibacter aurantiacus]